jgi:hypothetical protein
MLAEKVRKTPEMLTIRPIGSCRILTPLRRTRSSLGFRLADARYQGFIHTSAEALQALRFIRGEIAYPEKLLPLIARSPDLPELTAPADLQQPDAYVIELSSAKHVHIGEYSIQLNYTHRYFQDFFNDRERDKKFYRMAQADRLAERREWLETEPSFAKLSEENRELLASIEMEELDGDAMRADLAAILERTGDTPVLIQTHVDANDPAGNPLPRRQDVIETVTEVAHELGLPLLDPSPAMHAMGQMLAMEKGGRDLTHFTPRFADQLGRIIVNQYVRPACGLEDDAGDANRGDWARLEGWMTRLREGDLAETGHQVFTALRDTPDNAAARIMAGHISHAIGDHERAVELLRERVAHDDASDDDRLAMLASLHALGRAAETLALGREILAGEYESEAVYRACAQSASALPGEDALPFWKELVLRDEAVDEAGPALIALLKERGDRQETGRWAARIALRRPSDFKMFNLAWREAIWRGDHAMAKRLAGNVGELTSSQRIELVDRALRKDDVIAASLIYTRLDAAERENAPTITHKMAADLVEDGFAKVDSGALEAGAARI